MFELGIIGIVAMLFIGFIIVAHICDLKSDIRLNTKAVDEMLNVLKYMKSVPSSETQIKIVSECAARVIKDCVPIVFDKFDKEQDEIARKYHETHS